MVIRKNYLKKAEEKKRLKKEAGLISDRFPEVSSIVINMTYHGKKENPVLMNRMVNFLPSSYAYFNMECMTRGCEDGGFDLNRIISGQIKKHSIRLKGEMSCAGNNGILPSDHSRVSYEINIKYNDH